MPAFQVAVHSGCKAFTSDDPLSRTLKGVVAGAQITSKRGARCYIAVAGGINTPAYLGSRSTFPGGKLGGVQACHCYSVYICIYNHRI